MNNILREIEDAIESGGDQSAIALTGLEVVAMLLRKNRDYAGSAWRAPVLAPHLDVGSAILCRMSDKVERIANLIGGAKNAVPEKIEDTMIDLAGYAILYCAAPGRTVKFADRED